MPIKMIDAKTVKEWLIHHEALVVDVRDPEERAVASIPGSIAIPIANLSKRAIQQAIQAESGNLNQKLVMHCQFGKRGGKACEKLLLEDPKLEVYNLEGGISSWMMTGYATDKV